MNYSIPPLLVEEGLGVVILENYHLAPTAVGALLLHKVERVISLP